MASGLRHKTIEMILILQLTGLSKRCPYRQNINVSRCLKRRQVQAVLSNRTIFLSSFSESAPDSQDIKMSNPKLGLIWRRCHSVWSAPSQTCRSITWTWNNGVYMTMMLIKTLNLRNIESQKPRENFSWAGMACSLQSLYSLLKQKVWFYERH